MGVTHTYALLPVSKATYDEIAAALRAAEYDHVFGDDGEIVMHGLTLVIEKPPAPIDPTKISLK